jgi:ADP-heptose:LPS heptosyltransferase
VTTTATRPRLLVLRALGLGDLLTAVPALRALRRAYPGHETVLAAPAWLAPAVRLTGAVDRLLPASAPERAVPERLDWTGPPPDIAVDLHGNGPESRRPLQALRPGRLLGYVPGGPAAWREDEHERHRWCRLLAAYGIPADPGDLRVAPPVAPSPAPGATVVHPGADAAARCWPAERFAVVARGLREAGHDVVVTAGPGERALAEHVAALAGLPVSRVLGGEPGNGDTATAAGHRSVPADAAGRGPAPPARPGPHPARRAPRAGRLAADGGPGARTIALPPSPFAEPAVPPPGGSAALPLDRLAALAAHARAVVVGDTGPAHLATALGTPSVVLFGPVAPRLWGPPVGDSRHRALWHPAPDDTSPRPGDAHGDRADPRLLRVTPAEVLAAVARLPTRREAPADRASPDRLTA